MTKLVWLDGARRLTGDWAGRLRVLPPLRAPRRLPETVVLGMPHLAKGALSEHWLAKECGHRHWYLLAEAAGLAVPEFRDQEGTPIYAAFSGVSIDARGFADCREHDVLAVASRLVRRSRTRFVSEHRLSVQGRPIGRVVMVSVFVKRTVPGENGSVVRTEVDGMPPVADEATRFPEEAALAALRPADAASMDGPGVVIQPCPSLDFNGADFLYFASYIAFAERAEWALARDTADWLLVERRVAYFGNVDVGRDLLVTLADEPPTPDGLSRRIVLRDGLTAKPLALMVVRRRRPGSPAGKRDR